MWLAILATQPDPVLTQHLTALAAEVSLAAADPLDEPAKPRRSSPPWNYGLSFERP